MALWDLLDEGENIQHTLKQILGDHLHAVARTDFRSVTSVFTAGRIPQFDTARISKFSDDLYKREDGISHAVDVKRYSVIINDIQERLIS